MGAWDHGNSKELGGPLEFREGGELDYKLPEDYRLGVRFTHMSNASIYEHNPGEETLMATFSVPIGY